MNKEKIARGVRNNNPLNIKKGEKWQGLAEVQTDPVFCQFVSLEYGFRAALKLLGNYITGWGGKRKPANNVSSIIRAWAPPSENATMAYIDKVAASLAVHPLETISPNDRNMICRLAQEMAFVECGQKFELAVIQSAYDLL